MRSTLPFNDDWLYAPSELSLGAGDDQFEAVTLPHTNIVLPYHNFDNLEYQFISTYRKRFTLPEPLNGRRLYIEFDGAMTSTQVTINGHTFDEFDGGYVPFSYDLTDWLRDGENVLQVRLDSTERPDVPPNGYVVDYLTFGGIYRDVRLKYIPQVNIKDVFLKPQNVLTEDIRLEYDIRIQNTGSSAFNGAVEIGIVDPGGSSHFGQQHNISVPAHSEIVVTDWFDKESLHDWTRLWTLESPELYSAYIFIGYPDKETGFFSDHDALDSIWQDFGFRHAIFKDDGFYLNGEHVKLIGLDRHQIYPYIGGAAPARLQRKDADILKYELGLNIVRTSHYPQSPHFLQRCDEIGLLVFEEIPGWQFIGDNDWKALSMRDLESMIRRDRNHPSIILWGVRINESWDDKPFYTATNALAHQLDPTRQTGGVRYFQDSEFLEDVFTYNDFSNTIVEPKHTPHLVTEFSGHMYSTKSSDQEERQIEHALRHTRIQNQQMGMRNVTGAIGWCAFDYNTHREFGSGDRICYHGVMDMFRLPKFAAYFYASQGVKEPFLKVASFWTPGDRSTGGNDPLTIFTNCDEIEVFIGEDNHGRFKPDRATYANLLHPPITVAGLNLGSLSGKNYQDLRIVGYKDGAAAVEQRIEADGVPKQLILHPDDPQLNADGADMTRLVVMITDKYGNRLPYAFAAIQFEIEGPGELVGENPFVLVGGQAALYVKAGKQAGVVTVHASTARLPATEAKITVG